MKAQILRRVCDRHLRQVQNLFKVFCTSFFMSSRNRVCILGDLILPLHAHTHSAHRGREAPPQRSTDEWTDVLGSRKSLALLGRGGAASREHQGARSRGAGAGARSATTTQTLG